MTNNVQRNRRPASKKTRPVYSRMGYFRVDEETWTRLQAIADKQELAVSDLVRRAIRELLASAA